MRESPFQIFLPYADAIRVCFVDKHDAVFSDDDTAKVLDIPKTQLGSVKQVHGGVTIRIDAPQASVGEADGVVTDVRGITLTSRSADCQTFVAYDPMKHVIGALHVGWRGVLAGGIEEFFAVMNREWNCNAKDILIGAAPSLCKTCAEFTDPAKELPGISEGFTEGRCVDLVGIANKKLQDLGVLPAHTERMTGCTKCQSEEFWSYRGPDREKVMVGARNVLGIQLR